MCKQIQSGITIIPRLFNYALLSTWKKTNPDEYAPMVSSRLP